MSDRRIMRFESSVISYGSQTIHYVFNGLFLFESSVISYGSQTGFSINVGFFKFESSVISYGSGARLNNGQSF